jgi:hypothetical protein
LQLHFKLRMVHVHVWSSKAGAAELVWRPLQPGTIGCITTNQHTAAAHEAIACLLVWTWHTIPCSAEPHISCSALHQMGCNCASSNATKLRYLPGKHLTRKVRHKKQFACATPNAMVTLPAPNCDAYFLCGALLLWAFSTQSMGVPPPPNPQRVWF